MRQVLIQIPLNRPWNLGPFGEVPGFGFGVVLAIWALFGAWSVFAKCRQSGWRLKPSEDLWHLASWVGIALAIVYAIPALGNYLQANGSANFRDGLPIFGYGAMMFLGFSAATILAARRARSVGLPSDVIWDMAIWLILPGIVGARLFYLVQHGDRVFRDVPVSEWLVSAFNLSQGGIVLYGALLGGAAGYFTFCYVHRLRPLALADIIVPSVFVGIGFGRIGCLLNGCCYGAVTSMPWGIRFPADGAAFSDMLGKKLVDITATCTPPLQPTQIFSSIDGFMIACLTTWYFRYRRRNGEVLAVALIIYPITRFCMELLRADELGQIVFGIQTNLTISQLISIALFTFNIGFMIYLSKRPPVRDAIALPPASAPAAAR